MTDELIEAALDLLTEAMEVENWNPIDAQDMRARMETALRAPLRLRPVAEAPEGVPLLWYLPGDIRPIIGIGCHRNLVRDWRTNETFPRNDFRGWCSLPEVTDE